MERTTAAADAQRVFETKCCKIGISIKDPTTTPDGCARGTGGGTLELVIHIIAKGRGLMECVACAIGRRELDARILLETGTVIAFLDHEPINPGHVLICPKEHYSNVDELPNEVLNEVCRVSRLVYSAIHACYAPDGISLMNNNGAFNDLSHYHLHVFPRYRGDGFGWTSKNDGIVESSVLEKELRRLKDYV